jgi:SAM-dependent methyltransferase
VTRSLRFVEDPHIVATRAGYDAIAKRYAEAFGAALDDAPLDRGLLAGFAELVRRAHDDPQVLDVGSGPGEIAAHLQQLQLAVRGFDLSPSMVDIARRAHPGLTFDVGEMNALDVPDASVAAVVCWYSLIHIPSTTRPAAIKELRRVLRPGGYLLLAFQIGEGTLHFDEAFGHQVNLDFHRLAPDDVAALLDAAGLTIVARLVRQPEPHAVVEQVPRGVLIARTPLEGPAQ